MKKKAVVVGLGNIGKYVLEAIKDSPDFECVGLIRRVPQSEGEYSCVSELPSKPDVAILCVPSEKSEQEAVKYLEKGISVVDSFDIHSEINSTINRLDIIAKQNSAKAIIACGWDPGTDSLIRAVFNILNPNAETFTNFGPGMSMGHSVAARSIDGVKDAVSMTLPAGKGKHNRKVYIEKEIHEDEIRICEHLKQHNYFSKDPLEVVFVESAEACKNTLHGTIIEGGSHSPIKNTDKEENFMFSMSVNNPEVTARVLLASARAALRHNENGAFTIIDIPLVNFLEGSREENIAQLV